jgi:hypothetical protein
MEAGHQLLNDLIGHPHPNHCLFLGDYYTKIKILLIRRENKQFTCFQTNYRKLGKMLCTHILPRLMVLL